MNLRQVAEYLFPLLPEELKELQAHVDEFLPFRPPVPVDELVALAALFLAQELDDELVHIQHFGSTAYTDGKPHKGSDIDLIVVVKDQQPRWELWNQEMQLENMLKNSPSLSASARSFHIFVCVSSEYDHPDEELPTGNLKQVILGAKSRGKPVPILRLSAGKTSQTLG